ncbi:hypothetical protein AVEN_235891-1 [Araneus ventricosus]|uniref:Uncharacterized protein n=1 Tax=Araneus ventricosus TaxID=182803 RepID=A0A4Y2N2D5_ARAVE|nr:hypothetical protein AVEN_235891-1 [Araneus ventricosus]
MCNHNCLPLKFTSVEVGNVSDQNNLLLLIILCFLDINQTFFCSFDTQDESFEKEASSGGLVLQTQPQRRESFLYRPDNEFDLSPVSRHSSIGSSE